MSCLISFVLRFTIINIKVVYLLQCFPLERQYPLILHPVLMASPTQHSNIAVSVPNYICRDWGCSTTITFNLSTQAFLSFWKVLYYYLSKFLLCYLLHVSSGNPSNACWSPLIYTSYLITAFSYFTSLSLCDFFLCL